MKIGIVDDFKHCVDDLCEIVKVAGFEAVPIHVSHYPQKTSLEEVVEQLAGVQIVLLDHYMGASNFTGEDVAKKLPVGVLVVSISDSLAAEEYSNHYLCKSDLRNKHFFGRAVETVKKFAEMVSNKI